MVFPFGSPPELRATITTCNEQLCQMHSRLLVECFREGAQGFVAHTDMWRIRYLVNLAIYEYSLRSLTLIQEPVTYRSC